MVMLQQFSTEALVVILWVTDLLPTTPKITKLCLYELSSQIYQTFFWLEYRAIYSLETFTKIRLCSSFVLHAPEMLTVWEHNIQTLQLVLSDYGDEIKLSAQAAMEGTRVPNDHCK